MPPRSKIGAHFAFVLLFILTFCPPLWNFILINNNFWTVSARALIFHVRPWYHYFLPLTLLIIFEQRKLELLYFTWVFKSTRPFRGYQHFYPVTLEFDLFFENFNLVYNFWTVSARHVIFHMNIPSGKTFLWAPTFLTMWPWSWSLMFFKNFNLAFKFWTVSVRVVIFFYEYFIIQDVSMGINNFDLVTLYRSLTCLLKSLNSSC